jgi:hypothetical protein
MIGCNACSLVFNTEEEFRGHLKNLNLSNLGFEEVAQKLRREIKDEPEDSKS